MQPYYTLFPAILPSIQLIYGLRITTKNAPAGFLKYVRCFQTF